MAVWSLRLNERPARPFALDERAESVGVGLYGVSDTAAGCYGKPRCTKDLHFGSGL